MVSEAYSVAYTKDLFKKTVLLNGKLDDTSNTIPKEVHPILLKEFILCLRTVFPDQLPYQDIKIAMKDDFEQGHIFTMEDHDLPKGMDHDDNQYYYECANLCTANPESTWWAYCHHCEKANCMKCCVQTAISNQQVISRHYGGTFSCVWCRGRLVDVRRGYCHSAQTSVTTVAKTSNATGLTSNIQVTYYSPLKYTIWPLVEMIAYNKFGRYSDGKLDSMETFYHTMIPNQLNRAFSQLIRNNSTVIPQCTIWHQHMVDVLGTLNMDRTCTYWQLRRMIENMRDEVAESRLTEITSNIDDTLLKDMKNLIIEQLEQLGKDDKQIELPNGDSEVIYTFDLYLKQCKVKNLQVIIKKRFNTLSKSQEESLDAKMGDFVLKGQQLGLKRKIAEVTDLETEEQLRHDLIIVEEVQEQQQQQQEEEYKEEVTMITEHTLAQLYPDIFPGTQSDSSSNLSEQEPREVIGPHFSERGRGRAVRGRIPRRRITTTQPPVQQQQDRQLVITRYQRRQHQDRQ